jgi:myo-inositol-1(or 4)-monophosphatase
VTESFDDSALLAALEESARAAGQIALSYFRHGAQTVASVQSKEGGSPVTEADHAVDRFLTERLRPLLPQAGWLSEETADTDDRLGRDLIFVVDPIDGTRAFMAGDPRWAVCIGIVAAGQPVAGIIHLPAQDETFVAARGHGARRNGLRIEVSKRAHLEGGLMAGPAGLMKTMVRDGLDLRLEPRIPSLAYRIARVADGSLDAGIASTNACDWDIAAADIILTEAGGRLAGLDGRAPRYNRTDTRHGWLGAAARQLHGELTAALRQALEAGRQG